MDQERAGYARAVQGFRIDFSFQIYSIFQQVLWEVLQEEARKGKLRLLNLSDEIHDLNDILFQGYSIIAASFLKTREERITEKVTHLQELYDFTQEIITNLELEEIVSFILRRMKVLFEVEESYLALYRDLRIQGVYSCPAKQEIYAIQSIMEKTMREESSVFMDEEGHIYNEIGQSNLKRVVSIPVQAHGRCYGVLTLHNSTRGFKFTEKELGLLYQFIHIMAIALENAFMLEEIEQGRRELRLLTGKMITIQEEERKRLAADIHDTLAQTLTGINYKIQSCKALFKINPELLMDQFDDLIDTVHHAIDQSRELISSLRPDLIDTMGLVPALKRFFDNFMHETGIRVKTHLLNKIQMPSGGNICLFRVAQEALMNVYKHAKVNTVEVILKKNYGNIILVVDDKGKGFDMSQGAPWIMDQNKLGLLSMKERVEALGGTLVINAEINRGCRIEANIPLNAEASHNAED
jgi:signal transduction histidine kinase